MATPPKLRLGEILIRQQLLAPEQLDHVLREQKNSGRQLGRVRRVGRILRDKGYVLEDKIASALAMQLGLHYIDLGTFQVNAEVMQKLPEIQARRLRALLLEDNDQRCLVAMSDPTDLNASDELQRILQRPLEIAVVTESQLLETINRVYRHTSEITSLAHELKQSLADAVEFAAAPDAPGVEDAPVVRLLQTVFEDAVQARASDVHIEPQEKKLVVRFRIDGVLAVQTEADARIAAALVSRLKLTSGLDISEKRLPQDGRFNVTTKHGTVDVRISTMPVQHGESVVMRLLNHSSGLLTLQSLGLPDHILQRLKIALERPSGAILVTGPTGSGKTTTLYSALNALNTTERKIITVEDPVEYRLGGVNQVQVHDKIDLTFARVLRSALRQDPDVILVGEMRDQETVETGLRAAMTGHLVLSTLHTNDAITTPIRLLDMGAPRYMVAFALQLVIAQRLVRLVCESCQQPYVPTSGEREWLAQELGPTVDSATYRKGRGCVRCGGSGYLGRTGVYEMLEMTRSVVEAANRDDPAIFVATAQRELAGRTLRAHASELVARGRTTPEQAMRATAQVAGN